MVFSSALFLFIFLPIFLGIYYISGKRLRNIVALIGSYIFYAWGEPVFAIILFVTSFIDYLISRRIYRAENEVTRKLLLAFTLIMNFGLLGYYKYANFLVTELFDYLPQLENVHSNWSLIALPIGISFFTFQKASYVIDVYRKKVNPAENFIDFALYVALFPQLIAGPIVRYHDIYKQLIKRKCTADSFLYGVYRFSIGLGKKVLIANQLAYVADLILAQPLENLPMHYAWVAILCYTFQIYFDFSGYSDMAIGLGKMMGFTFLENFNRPYISKSITEFWRRWHISLSNWMVEYLYIPLGGNRAKPWRLYLNLWIVFLISGLWHGASWSFIAWGAYHGFFLSLERIIGLKRIEKIPEIVALPLTFFIVVGGWVFFRIESIKESFVFFERLVDFNSMGQLYLALPVYQWVDNRFIIISVLAIIFSFNPFFNRPARRELLPDDKLPGVLKLVCSILILVLCFASLSNSSYNPFIYYRF